jgi:hypothetical protein
MKTYTIYFEEAFKVEIEAKNKDEALDKFKDAEYDEPEYLEITGYDIIDEVA